MVADQARAPRLHVFARSHGGENRKGRPDFYDKTTCLASLIAAAEAVTPPAELVFVNDGPLPADREQLMVAAGDVLQGEFGSNRNSFRSTVAMAAERPFDDDDLVWFAEDDYLYRPNAFLSLLEVAQRLTQAQYFSLNAGELVYRPATPVSSDVTTDPAAAAPGQTAVDWVPSESTTSSFAVRVRQLREDAGLLRLMPFTGGAFDHATFLALQGRYPFTRDELRQDLLPLEHPVAQWPRPMLRGVVRSAVGLRALRRPSRRRTLYGPTGDLIAHLEIGAFDPSEDWESLAHESWAWVERRRTGAGGPPTTIVGQTPS